MPLNSKIQTDTKSIKLEEKLQQLLVFFPSDSNLFYSTCKYIQKIQIYFYNAKEKSLQQINKSKEILVFF